MSLLPPNIYPDTPGTKRLLLQTKASWAPTCSHPCNRRSSFVPEPKADLPWLIAHFGDACSSSWLEARYDIWRGVGSTWEDPKVQGYMRCGKWLFAWGNLLCQPTKERRRETAEEFVKWAKEEGLKVVWCCVDSGFEEVLAEGVDGVGWSTLSCLREDVLHPETVRFKNRDVKQNLRRADRADLTCDELRLWDPEYLPDHKTKTAVDEGLEAWRKSRQGRQIASASLDPWLDASNRRYFLARTPHEIVGICVLTPIAGEAYQIKHAVQFPSGPRGTSEAFLTHVIKEMKGEGRPALTFGASATEHLVLERNIRRGVRMRILEKGYSFIVSRTSLTQRGRFRSKFETEEGQLLHISFPPHGFGVGGLIALMKVLRVQ